MIVRKVSFFIRYLPLIVDIDTARTVEKGQSFIVNYRYLKADEKGSKTRHCSYIGKRRKKKKNLLSLLLQNCKTDVLLQLLKISFESRNMS